MNEFNFFIGADIDEETFEKATKGSKSDKYNNMVLYGLASDNTEDQQGEILEPAGYQIDDFLKSGYINLEHYTVRKGSPEYWIGEPLEANVKGNEFYIKSKLWKDHPLARNFWDTMLIMKSSGSTRRPGYSIEGKAMEKDPENKKRITKAKIINCALTFNPVQANSWVDIAKGQQIQDYIKPDYSTINGGKTYILQFEKDGNIITVNKDYSVDIKPKATTVESMKPIIKEELDKDMFNYILKGVKEGFVKKEIIPLLIKKLK